MLTKNDELTLLVPTPSFMARVAKFNEQERSAELFFPQERSDSSKLTWVTMQIGKVWVEVFRRSTETIEFADDILIDIGAEIYNYSGNSGMADIQFDPKLDKYSLDNNNTAKDFQDSRVPRHEKSKEKSTAVKHAEGMEQEIPMPNCSTLRPGCWKTVTGLLCSTTEQCYKAEIALFAFGNGTDEYKNIILSGCMLIEFEIAEYKNKIIIAIASTAYAAKEISIKIEREIKNFQYLEDHLYVLIVVVVVIPHNRMCGMSIPTTSIAHKIFSSIDYSLPSSNVNVTDINTVIALYQIGETLKQSINELKNDTAYEECSNTAEKLKLMDILRVHETYKIDSCRWCAIAPIPPETGRFVNKATITVKIIVIKLLLVLLFPIGEWLQKIIMAPIQIGYIEKACPKVSVQAILINISSLLTLGDVSKPSTAPGKVETLLTCPAGLSTLNMETNRVDHIKETNLCNEVKELGAIKAKVFLLKKNGILKIVFERTCLNTQGTILNELADEIVDESNEGMTISQYINIDNEKSLPFMLSVKFLPYAQEIAKLILVEEVLNVLDEFSIGLHQRDNVKLRDTLKQMQDLDDTLLVAKETEDGSDL
uniref:UvrABC system protein A n=1 Tax=Eufriesea mexicana TaxID=516756 RepID=A0A310SQ68_9HYME